MDGAASLWRVMRVGGFEHAQMLEEGGERMAYGGRRGADGGGPGLETMQHIAAGRIAERSEIKSSFQRLTIRLTL